MSGQDISLKNIKPENTLGSKFYFEITNVSDSIRVYSVSLEEWADTKGWYEIKGDVFNYATAKRTKVFKITVNSTTKHFFYPSKLIKSTNRHNKYRLKVSYGKAFNNKSMTIYSQAFIFKN